MTSDPYWLAIIFMVLMGFALLVYAILDGYDLGVGILMPLGDEHEQWRDTMIASIGPFWDANETWLVLAVGILLIAFPAAYSTIFYHLYIPALCLLIGLILRGVAFDFRAKAPTTHKGVWDRTFKCGSTLAAASQGYMLGQYVVGFSYAWQDILFSLLSALCVSCGYSFIGAAWLVMKTEGALQAKAARWARGAGWIMALGIILVSVANLLMGDDRLDKWLGFPQVIALLPIPLLTVFLFVLSDRYLSHFPHQKDFGSWIPFVCAMLIFFLCFQGLAYSFFPYVVQNELTIWQAASAPESLRFILYGIVLVMPAIIGYTLFSYRVFWGKASGLKY